MEIGKMIFYNNKNGEVIYVKGDMIGDVVETPIQRVISLFNGENTYNNEDISYIELEYGVNMKQTPTSVNLDTLEITWIDLPVIPKRVI